MARRRFLVLFFAALLPLFWLALARDAGAAPEAHILRIDPRAGLQDGKPILTTVIEVVQFKRLSDVLRPARASPGPATLNCWSEQLEKPGALFDPFPFPEQNAHFLVKVVGRGPASRSSSTRRSGARRRTSRSVGTAWLVAVDSSSAMGSRFGDARAIAHELIEEMQPNDLMDLMFFDDVQVVSDTKWKTYKQRADLGNALNAFKSTSPSHGRDRALFSQIKNDDAGRVRLARKLRPAGHRSRCTRPWSSSRTAPGAATPRARAPAPTSSTSTSTRAASRRTTPRSRRRRCPSSRSGSRTRRA